MNNWNIILNIAKTHLLTKAKQTFIAALGVTFGIGSYITLVCFMTGLNTMLDNLMLNQTPHIHIYNEIEPSKVQPIALYEEFSQSLNVVRSIRPKLTQKKIHNAFPIIKYLNHHEQVRRALPQVKSQIFYMAGSIDIGGILIGVNPLEEAEFFNMADYIVAGSAAALNQTENGVLLGIGIAEKMALKVGDRVQVSPVNGSVFSLKIVGLYQSGIADLDAVQSFTTLKTVQRVLGEPNNYITDINVKLYDIENAIPLAQHIEKEFQLTALDIKTANAQFETGTTIRNLITYAVSITLLIVAGFGIYNILNMLIYEKMNDIAILKATGFSGRDVQLIFISQAMIIGLVGGVLGLLIGWGLTTLIDHVPFNTEALPTISTYPINQDPLYFVIGFLFAMFSTFLAGYLPALKAKHIDPVKIIRGQ
ncbi:ABC transporter permease [Winogradskyella rapida]|uniref:ABC transporter permease n=1 Tax=Winogradskyella rapida TaxID=549701 RepID=A0ABW3KVD8_9FLAO